MIRQVTRNFTAAFKRPAPGLGFLSGCELTWKEKEDEETPKTAIHEPRKKKSNITSDEGPSFGGARRGKEMFLAQVRIFTLRSSRLQ